MEEVLVAAQKRSSCTLSSVAGRHPAPERGRLPRQDRSCVEEAEALTLHETAAAEVEALSAEIEALLNPAAAPPVSRANRSQPPTPTLEATRADFHRSRSGRTRFAACSRPPLEPKHPSRLRHQNSQGEESDRFVRVTAESLSRLLALAGESLVQARQLRPLRRLARTTLQGPSRRALWEGNPGARRSGSPMHDAAGLMIARKMMELDRARPSGRRRRACRAIGERGGGVRGVRAPRRGRRRVGSITRSSASGCVPLSDGIRGLPPARSRRVEVSSARACRWVRHASESRPGSIATSSRSSKHPSII